LVAGQGRGEDVGDPAGFADRGDLGLDGGAGPAGLAAGQFVGQHAQALPGLGQGLVEAAGLPGVQAGGVGQDRAAGHPERGDGGVHIAQTGEPVGVHGAVVGAADGEQVGVVAGWQGSDEPDLGGFDLVLVGGRVLPGVVDQGQIAGPAGQMSEPGGQLFEHQRELGDVGPVTGVGVRQQRDAAIAGDDQAQTDQPQVRAFLLGFPALGDGCLVVAGVDVGGEVRHVQDQPGQVQAVVRDDPGTQLGLDRGQVRLGQPVHHLPEPAVVQRRRGQLQPAWPGGVGPPVGEAEFRAWSDDPVRAGQRQVGTRRRGGVRPPGHDPVDDLGYADAFDHRPDRGQIPELLVLATHGLSCRLAGQLGRYLLGRAQILLRDDPWLAIHPGGLHQVVVGLASTALTHNRRHIWVIQEPSL
jgi:hypothetical protein